MNTTLDITKHNIGADAHGVTPWASCALVLCILLVTAAPALAQSAAHEQFLFAYKLLQRGEDHLAADAFDEYLGSFPRDDRRADGLYYRALLHHRAGENQQAAERLEDVGEPQIAPAYAIELLRGQVLADLDRHDDALAALERINGDELSDDVAASWRYLRGRAYREADNLAAAEEQFAAAAERDSPLRAKALIDLARVQVLRERESDAIDTLRRSLDIARGDELAEAARLAGDLNFRLGKHEQAVQYYDRVIAGHQGSRHFGPAVVGVLWAHHAAERHRQLLEAWQELEALLPRDRRVAARYLVGSAHQALGQHGAAAEQFAAVAFGQGKHEHLEQALFKLAVSQHALGQHDEMPQTLDRLREQYPESDRLPDAAYLLATMEAQGGDVARGAARLTELIDQGANHPYHRAALLRRARLYAGHERPAAAADDFGRFVEASWQADDHGQTVQQAALRWIDLLHRQGKHEQADAAAGALLERDGTSAEVEQEALYRRALVQVRLNQTEAALATLDRLDERHPLHPYASRASYYRGLLLTALGRADEAAAALARAADDDDLARPLRANALRLVALRHRESGDGEAARRAMRQFESLAGAGQLNERERLWLARDAVEQDEAARALDYLAPLVVEEDGMIGGGSTPEVRAEAAYLAGRAERIEGNPDRAIHLFSYVDAMGRGFEYEARLERARTLADAGRLDAALNDYRSLTARGDPTFAVPAYYESAQAQRKLAEQRLRRDDRAGVAEATEQAQLNLKRITLLYADARFEPWPQLAWLELAALAHEREDSAAAIANLEELLEKFPEGDAARLARATLAAEQGRPDEARRLLVALRERRVELDARLLPRLDALHQRLES